MDYRGNVSMPCGQCGQTIKIPIRVYDGVSGVCMLCGCMVSARRQGDTMHLHTMLSKPHLLVTDRNRYNVGVAHEELALLYRMMNCFDEALLELQEALKIAEDLLENNPDHREYLALKSLAIFRQAEIYHCQGSRMKAKELYQVSLAIDRTLNNEEGIQTITALYSKLE
jgi:tetratricopeptide (TPR) repeat protein